MLGLVLIYTIGKWFSTLAFDYNKSRWGYAILGVVTYYGGTMIFGFLLGILIVATGNESMLEWPNFVLNLIALPFGLLAAWILRTSLQKHWEKQAERVVSNPDLLDDLK
jgi:hypothetical protein